MTSRVDTLPTRLSVAFNELTRRQELTKLPDNLQGNALPDIIHAHEKALADREGRHATEGGSRHTAAEVHAQTARLLTRLRYAILAAYDDPEDPRIHAYGELGVSHKQQADQVRLGTLATKVVEPLKKGEIALVADLQPDKLAAQAKLHDELNKGKAGATADRQVGSDDLAVCRVRTHETLQRIKNFVKTFHGPGDLSAYGFGLPVPPSRPRLTGVANDTPPAQSPATTASK